LRKEERNKCGGLGVLKVLLALAQEPMLKECSEPFYAGNSLPAKTGKSLNLWSD
jgi:hypothetical protein